MPMFPVRHFNAALTRRAYWLAVLLPLMLPLGWLLRDLPGIGWLHAWLIPLGLYLLLPLADGLLGRAVSDPPQNSATNSGETIILCSAAASWALVLLWALIEASKGPDAVSAWTLAGLTLSLINLGGVIAINVAHELIHRRSRWQRTVGTLLLCGVFFPCFKLVHPRWHHAKVATADDPSSAPRGSNVYWRAPRAWWLNTRRGFLLAAGDARRRGRPGWLNEMVGWYGLSLGLALATLLALGPLATGLFLIQGIGAALLLEVINYVEHYGLRRSSEPGSRPELQHSWDSSYWLSNALLLQLPRHADHHVNPGRPYPALRRSGTAPQLPVTYSLAVLLALLPPLWWRLMDDHLPQEEHATDCGARPIP